MNTMDSMYQDLSLEFDILQKKIETNVYIKQGTDLEEPLLDPLNKRLTLDSVHDQEIWDIYKKHTFAFWVTDEIDFTGDDKRWEELTDECRYFIKHILAFFANSDEIVNLNIINNFSKDVCLKEAQKFYNFQVSMEDIHNETYQLLIDSYIKDKDEKDKLKNAIKYIPCIYNKLKWAVDWMTSNDSFAKRLIAFAIVEGIYFSGSFCAIYWIQQSKNPLKALTQANELIARDEGLHTEFACLLYQRLNNKLPDDQVHNIIKEAVIIEKEFICTSLPCGMIGMNSDLMSQYIEFVADRLCNMLGYEKIYNSENPFEFMKLISLDKKTNMFEGRITNYSKSNESFTYNISDDF